MKKLLLLTTAVAMLSIWSCTKEGPQGPPGTNGQDGKDANATCTQCHNFADSLVAKIFQYDASQHATGHTAFEGTRNTCAPCHCSQGYMEILVTGADTTQKGFNDAAPINCRTCHNIHVTYTPADYGLRTGASTPFSPRYDKAQQINLAYNNGESNLCARCHQARKANPWVTDPKGLDSIRVSSFRWGPHYGTQGLMLAGKGAFETGDIPFQNTMHKDVSSCGTCHMAAAQAQLAGGHSLWMTNEEEGIVNTAGCKNAGCHPSANSFDVNGRQTEIAGMIQQLKVLLAEASIADTSSGSVYLNTSTANPKKFTQIQLAIFWNFKLAYHDRSYGVHNYAYTRDMLQSGINYLNSN